MGFGSFFGICQTQMFAQQKSLRISAGKGEAHKQM
jgi:hypothetical protein